ncbi:MAG: hypothetical protein LBK07_06495 [Tannerella sp.]|nr:hypothetical protein [Tannerella sp.]
MATSIPRKDTVFNERQEVITVKVKENLTAWGINALWFTGTLEPVKEEWVKAWADYQDPMQRTRLITFTKKEKRRVYEKLLRMLVRMLGSSPTVTDDDRRAMGIVIRDTVRTPVKLPKSYPVFTVDTSIIRCLIIFFRDMGSMLKAKPHGVHGVEICWAILDRPPVSVDELIHSAFDTRAPFRLMFDESERGRTVYICLRWENTRGEKGPWSEIVMAIVP